MARDHVEEALARIPGHLAGATLVRAIVQVWAERAQVFADVRRELVRALDLSSATIEGYPFALALWGELLGTPRRAVWSAAQYRRILLAAVVARRSRGTTADVLATAEALRPPGDVRPVHVDAGPIYVQVVIPGLESDSIMQEAARMILLRAIPDVAELTLVFANPEDLLKFDEEDKGFDGGQFA